MKIISDSKCILDSSQDGQIGLAIWIIEYLGAKRKVITTNADVKNYDFYKEKNVYIYKKYSLKSWLDFIINDIRG